MSRVLRAALLLVVVLVASIASGKPSSVDRLLALAKTFPGASTLDAAAVVKDIMATTSDETEQRFLLTWGYFESNWGAVNLGDCTCTTANGSKTTCPNIHDRHIGNCTSFGVMQTKRPADWVPGATPKRVIVDRRLGFQVGLAIFRYAMKVTKGDLRAALRLYSKGKTTIGYELVDKRCKLLGC